MDISFTLTSRNAVLNYRLISFGHVLSLILIKINTIQHRFSSSLAYQKTIKLMAQEVQFVIQLYKGNKGLQSLQ